MENMLRNMTKRASIFPYFTNHSLRATTVTVLSTQNVETRKIKAVTGHRSDTSIESNCERPTLNQFKHMSSAITSFIHGNENEQTASTSKTDGVPGTSALAPAESLLGNSSISTGRNELSILQSNGVNPGAILPSGTFQECPFTFNINVNNNKN
jgi:hypothetical protein